MTGRLVSRGGGGGGYPVSSSGGNSSCQRLISNLSCNRCRKPLATTVFVCSCDCVFCEECTYEHFNSNANCPCCSKNLGADDFMELCVADPSAATHETTKNTFQNMLTKISVGSKGLSHQEMCSRLLKNLDDDRRAVRFLMKQFVFESSNQGQQSGSMGRAYEQLKQEHTQLKQASSSQRIQFEQTIADLQHRNQALKGTVQNQQTSLDEKETQISQFRQLYAAESISRLPSSSYSASSGGKPNRRPAQPQPPMQGFIMQKEARERAKEQEMTRARPSFGQQQHSHMMSTDSVITPIQLPQRPLSSHSLGGPPTIPPSTPRIRDLSSTSGYVFTSRSANPAKHPRSHSPGFGSFVPPSSSNRYAQNYSSSRR